MSIKLLSSIPGTKRLAHSYNNDQPRPLASSTQRKTTSRKCLNQTTIEGVTRDNTPNAIHSQPLAEAITTAMSKGLGPLLATKATKNKPTKYRSTRDGIVDGWLMLMKRNLEKAHARDNPLDRAWTTVEFLENEARDSITIRGRTRYRRESLRTASQQDPNTTTVLYTQTVTGRELYTILGRLAQ